MDEQSEDEEFVSSDESSNVFGSDDCDENSVTKFPRLIGKHLIKIMFYLRVNNFGKYRKSKF